MSEPLSPEARAILVRFEAITADNKAAMDEISFNATEKLDQYARERAEWEIQRGQELAEILEQREAAKEGVQADDSPVNAWPVRNKRPALLSLGNEEFADEEPPPPPAPPVRRPEPAPTPQPIAPQPSRRPKVMSFEPEEDEGFQGFTRKR